ncbi:VirB8 protein [Mycolicibacterium gilvum]|uniref:VirB8 protein n=2 Tax=Mycolicibacterium gilvum TaxID=1804 RepID=E6TC97_MYCSR|nr:hypothetical protein Mspyr1_19530 [Mycolicibacterium gilvum Spyr1]STZ44687.1 VirB8 protein [Mycolicibacterium gilvum]
MAFSFLYAGNDREVGVPSFRRRDSVIEADRVEESTVDPEGVPAGDRARALADVAEAEAAEAEAMAAAARARARAAKLRQEALAAAADSDGETARTDAVASNAEATDDADDAEPLDLDDVRDDDLDGDETAVGEAGSPTRKRRLRRPGWASVGVALVLVIAVLGTAALLAVSGYMRLEHRDAENLRQQNAEYAAAARQSVVTLMSLDFNKAEEDVQRIIDNSTGQFKDDFESQAAEFVKVAQDSKVVTEVTVNSTAVERMTGDGAEVLVAASSRVTNTAGADQEPRTWRLSVSLVREDGQIKMSKVEFVP